MRDVGSSQAGGSRVLFDALLNRKINYESIRDAIQKLREYESPRKGYACMETTALRIRKYPSTDAPIIGQLLQKDSVTIYGEYTVHNEKWYHVIEDTIDGYVYAEYISFSEKDMNNFYDRLAKRIEQRSKLPTEFLLREEPEGISDDVRDEINFLRTEIKDCINVQYPKAVTNASALNQYWILDYLYANYDKLKQIGSEYGLKELYYRAVNDQRSVDYLRLSVLKAVNATPDEMVDNISSIKAERERKKRLSIGEQIANYAATFVGWLPYIWGGASLVTGADCSGFCAQIYAHFGFYSQYLADTHALDSAALRYVGTPVSLADIQPGDMVCYTGHVAIYYGGNVVVHEPSIGKKCSFGNLYMAPILTIRRMF